MKIKNITKNLQIVKNPITNWDAIVAPNEIIEMEKPIFNKKHFIIINENGGIKNV